MPNLSIIVPTFQRRATVVRLVLHLDELITDARMSPHSIELIVAVDGSNDGTSDELRALRTSVRLVVVEQLNRGRASARNLGLRSSSNSFVWFLDEALPCCLLLAFALRLSSQSGIPLLDGVHREPQVHGRLRVG